MGRRRRKSSACLSRQDSSELNNLLSGPYMVRYAKRKKPDNKWFIVLQVRLVVQTTIVDYLLLSFLSIFKYKMECTNFDTTLNVHNVRTL